MVDSSDQVTRGNEEWRDLYIAQGEHKRKQIEAMIRYAQSHQCRMSSLVHHFGDVADSRKPCGVCDFCAPESCVAQRFRAATAAEEAAARAVLRALSGNGRSAGQLHAEICGDRLDRDQFEEILGAMARVGLVRLMDAVFEKDGKQIPYRKVYLTREGEELEEDAPLELSIREAAATLKKSGRKKKGGSPKEGTKKVFAKKKKAEAAPEAVSLLAAALRAWRTFQAKKQGVPAFRIMSDRVLMEIVENEPRSAADLLAIPGMGIASVQKYGAQIYKIVGDAVRG
jgi:superfamily II DNA helicase RecQ